MKYIIMADPLTLVISISRTSHLRSTIVWCRWRITPEICSIDNPALRSLCALEHPARLSAALGPPAGLFCIVHWQEILSPSPPVFSLLPLSPPSPLPSLISKACAPCACFFFCCQCLFPPFESCLLVFSCSKTQLLLEFLFFILTFQKKAVSLHPQRI